MTIIQVNVKVLEIMGFGLGSVVKHMLKYPKVVGSNPSRSCFFVLFLPFLHEQSRFLNEMHVYLWCEKCIPRFAAWGETG